MTDREDNELEEEFDNDELENDEDLEAEEDFDDDDLDDEDDEDDDNGGRPRRRSGPPRSRSRGSRFSGGRSFGRRPRFCSFCAEGTTAIDYKQIDLLRRYVTDQGKIRGRRQTGTCARHQRMLSRAVKRARHMALLPFAGEIRR